MVIRTVFLLLVTSVALAQPTVVSTDPLCGTQNVAGPTVTITVKFSEPMQNQWSVVASDVGELPEVVGEPWFSDPQTWQIRVSVKPGTKYALGLNSQRHQKFRSAANDTPLAPSLINFSTAAQGAAPVTPPQPAEQGTVSVSLDQFAAYPEGEVSFPPGWRPGETREKIQTVERNSDFTLTPGGPARSSEKYVYTSALQVGEAADGAIQRARGQLLKAEAYETDPQTGQLAGGEQPVPGTVVDMTAAGATWTARTQGAAAPADAVQQFLLLCAVDNPFAPRKRVQEGEQWQLQGQLLQAAGDLLNADGEVAGTIACRFAGRGEVSGHPSAQITHEWKVQFAVNGVTCEGVGQGTSTYLTDGRKFISNTVQLRVTVPRQQLQDGRVIQGTGTINTTERLRYFAEGQYRELTPGAAPAAVQSGAGGAPRVDNTPTPGQVGPGGPPVGAQALVGTWVSNRMGYVYSLTFAAGGAYTSTHQAPGGKPVQGGGSYQASGDVLELRPQGLTGSRKYQCRMPNPRTLQMVDELGRTMVFTRQ